MKNMDQEPKLKRVTGTREFFFDMKFGELWIRIA